jgi:hypothetical protein
MKQPWINNKKRDLAFVLMPPFIILLLIVFFQSRIQLIEHHYSFYTWLFLIVFVDVAHVYATLFKTYFKPSAFQKNRKLYIWTPIICLFLSCFLFGISSHFFWSVLAYVAVYHFVRQQYGFMRLYSKQENLVKRNRVINNLAIYTSTGYPMIYWFMSGTKNFNWFVDNEFLHWENPLILYCFSYLYFGIFLVYVINEFVNYRKSHFFNLPKNLLLLGTALSWYFGIVYFNDDLIFTALNVISHGIPYMALVYFKELENNEGTGIPFFRKMKWWNILMFYILFLLGIAFVEEFLWDVFVWKENFSNISTSERWMHYQFFLVPLLSVPQFTHYILDGFIWKRSKK